MALNQTKNSFAQRRKASIKRKKKTKLWNGENICKQWDEHPKYIRTHTIQYQKTNYLIKKNGIFPKKTYRHPTGTWKEAQHY